MSEKETKKLYNGITGIDDDIIEGAQSSKPHKKAKSPVWIKWGAVAACLALVCVAVISLFPNNNDSVTTPGIADAAPMIYVNDTLYKQSTSQTSFSELKDDFVYLGIIESDITNFQGTNDAENYLDGIPKENFQANHPIVGAEVYQYNEDIVVQINGEYWLYETLDTETHDNTKNELSEEEKEQSDPSYNAN